MKRSALFLCAVLAVHAARAESVSLLVAGGELQKPFAVAIDKAGTLYAPSFTGNRVFAIDSSGKLSVVAGTGKAEYSGDKGAAAQAGVNWIHNIVVASDGHLYIADTGNFCIRKVDLASKVITTFAGTGKKGFSGDGGPAAQAEFGGVYCLAVNVSCENMYAADLDNRRIRVIDMKSGVVSTFAGNGKKGIPQDGAVAADAPLVDPRAVAVDSKNNVYILERSGNALRVVDASGKIKTVAGTGKKGGAGSGANVLDGLQATFADPKHLCIDREDNVIIADSDNHVIRKFSPATGKIENIAGGKTGHAALTNGIAPLDVELNQPHGVFVDEKGTLYIADSFNDRILKIAR